MSLFRINSDTPFRGPHQDKSVVTAGSDPENAASAMILIHGRGATAQILDGLGAEVTNKIYPNMGHTMNRDEIEKVKKLLGHLSPF